jgi:hypothetical protein
MGVASMAVATVKMILGVVMWLLCAPALLIIMGAIGLVGSLYSPILSGRTRKLALEN